MKLPGWINLTVKPVVWSVKPVNVCLFKSWNITIAGVIGDVSIFQMAAGYGASSVGLLKVSLVASKNIVVGGVIETFLAEIDYALDKNIAGVAYFGVIPVSFNGSLLCHVARSVNILRHRQLECHNFEYVQVSERTARRFGRVFQMLGLGKFDIPEKEDREEFESAQMTPLPSTADGTLISVIRRNPRRHVRIYTKSALRNSPFKPTKRCNCSNRRRSHLSLSD